MGIAVTFVTASASILTWLVSQYILKPLNVLFLDITIFILVIAFFVQLVEMFIRRYSETLYRALGIYLPLITTNCVVLGVALININENYSFVASAVNGLATGLGFTLALLLMSGIRERLELSNVPEPLKGIPIAFIIAGLMSIAFMAFSGMI